MATMSQANPKTRSMYQLADGWADDLPLWLDLPDEICLLMGRKTRPFKHEWVWAKARIAFEYDPVRLTQRDPVDGSLRHIRKVFVLEGNLHAVL